MKKSIFIIGLAIAVMACNNTKKPETVAIIPEQAGNPVTIPAPGLFGNEWHLTVLNGEAIVLDTILNKAPFLVFDKENGRVTGRGGCNGFGGNFSIKEDGKIELSQMIATLMACPNLDLEQRFFEVLKNVKSYSINGNTLILKNDSGEAAAEFKKAE